jgi:hypothetical protein
MGVGTCVCCAHKKGKERFVEVALQEPAQRVETVTSRSDPAFVTHAFAGAAAPHVASTDCCPSSPLVSHTAKQIHQTVTAGGKVLVPVFAVGRAQELLLLLDEHWQRTQLEVRGRLWAVMTPYFCKQHRIRGHHPYL